MRVLSTTFPNLLIVDPPVQFVDGVADVSPEFAAQLAAYAVHGVVVGDVEPEPADGEPADADDPKPKAPNAPAPADAPKDTASRGEWAAYAESLGVEPGDRTKAQLIAALSE